VVLALAQALIDHPERTLNREEIKGLAADQARRAAWGRTVENAARFAASLTN
jgi:hypothetical protein